MPLIKRCNRFIHPNQFMRPSLICRLTKSCIQGKSHIPFLSEQFHNGFVFQFMSKEGWSEEFPSVMQSRNEQKTTESWNRPALSRKRGLYTTMQQGRKHFPGPPSINAEVRFTRPFSLAPQRNFQSGKNVVLPSVLFVDVRIDNAVYSSDTLSAFKGPKTMDLGQMNLSLVRLQSWRFPDPTCRAQQWQFI